MSSTTKRFGTFEGVFTPTVLSILGVIMYLRLGWVVGQVGLGKALIIIGVANMITLLTGLSISSITTNMRVGAGGAYAMISKSLGLEVGGAIGIPLYISQAISVAFYIVGFTECWNYIFPSHDFLATTIVVWGLLLVISYTSARLAFRLQYVIMVVIGFSLVSAFLGEASFSQRLTLWVANGDSAKFWKVFAIFFPAVTGILAGVSMSGELKQPEKDIPVGTLLAIMVGFVVYTSLAVWFSLSAPRQELIDNNLLIIAVSRWPALVIGGIMGATLSSALSMFVAGPRTLLALGRHKQVPFLHIFDYLNSRSEPTHAILLTAFLSLLTLTLGRLNSIAGILTMFFLITYGMINIAVFIEKGIGIVSFRPTFKIPLVVSLLGGAGCVYVMFLIDPLFSVIAIAVTIALYLILIKRQAQRYWPDVRKGLFIFIAEQAIKVASRLPYHPKIWKPNLVIPVEKPKEWLGLIDFIRAIVSPNGKADFFVVRESAQENVLLQDKKQLVGEMELLSAPLREEGILASTFVIDAEYFLAASRVAVQVLKGTPLPPNVLFIKLGSTDDKTHLVKELIETTEVTDFGIMVFYLHPKLGFGMKKSLNIWIRRGSPNVDLAVLVALQIEKNWEVALHLIQVVDKDEENADAFDYLERLKRVMRLPLDTRLHVLRGPFEEAITQGPVSDINVFGMPPTCDLFWMRRIAGKVNTSVLFLRDSKQEKATV